MHLWQTITFILLFYSTIAYNQTDSLVLFAEAGMNKLDCAGDETDITVTAQNGQSPYDVFWENTTTGDTGSVVIQAEGFFEAITPAKGGIYNLFLTDNTGQNTERTIQIAEPLPIQFQLDSTPSNCEESENGTASLFNISGGTVENGYQITWLSIPTQHHLVATSLAPDLYTVLVTDDRDCAVADTIRVASLPQMEITETLTTPKCAEGNNGTIDVEISGAAPPYFLNWSNNAQTGNTKRATDLKGGEYTLTVTDGSGLCQIADTFVLETPLPLEIELDVSPPFCQNPTGSVHIQNVKNAVLPVYYSTNNLGFHAETSFDGIEPGFHTLYVRDANDCRAATEFQIPEPIPLAMDLGQDYLILLGDSIQLSAEFEHQDNMKFLWRPATGLDCTDCPNPIAKPKETTTYTLFLKDSTDCEVSDEVTIWIQKNRSVFIPNAFSPDGDGQNDHFMAFTEDGTAFLYSMQIFNRWGTLVFEKKGKFNSNIPENGWNGKMHGQPLPSGTYFYHIGMEFLDGEILWYQGEMLLVR